MKIVLERNQRSAGMMGKRNIFSVAFRAEITQQQRDAINKYQLGAMVLYQSGEALGGTGIMGAVSRAYLRSKIKSLSVNDLVSGKTIECDDIAEMLEVEAQVVEAATALKSYLEAASTFGGRHIVEV